ncbi:hypothetical protein [Nioella aestuarii]|uniref:hypothetical protein n=1 Tax=Nioella aestuarii TaxID=1662864 RepID=UPI003D7F74C8
MGALGLVFLIQAVRKLGLIRILSSEYQGFQECAKESEMAHLQINSSHIHAESHFLGVWITRFLYRVARKLAGRQDQPHWENDLHRLAETSPHLLDDIGAALDAQPREDVRPAWTRGP